MPITQRRFPYPYKALLAICSDIDAMHPWQFITAHKFLNTLTRAIPHYGDGVGLDIGDSFFFKNISNKGISVYDACYRYKNEDLWANEFAGEAARLLDPTHARDPVTGRLVFEDGAKFIEKYIKAGWIDVLHGGDGNWGESAFRRGATDWCRGDGEHYMEWMAQRGLIIDTFSNHSAVTSDFGVPDEASTPEKPRSIGDLPSSAAYWADYARESGIKFYWSYIPTESAAYRHTFGQNTMLVPATFRDGSRFWHFSRYSSGKHYADTVQAILNRANLDSLVSGNKFEVAYTHFGYRSRPANHGWLASLKRMIDLPGRIHRRISPAARNRWLARVNAVDTHTKLSASSIRSFRLLKAYQDQGKILVAKNSRLLRYNLALDHLAFTEARTDGRTVIDITAINDTQFGDFSPTINDLRGVTFYVADSSKAEIQLHRTRIPESETQRNPDDDTGRQSIGIKWFQPDYTDYAGS